MPPVCWPATSGARSARSPAFAVPPFGVPLPQKVDAELSRALATLESEKEAAMKTLDAQVRGRAAQPGCTALASPPSQPCWTGGRRVPGAKFEHFERPTSPMSTFSACASALDAQVEKLSADILGRVLPEGVKV